MQYIFGAIVILIWFGILFGSVTLLVDTGSGWGISVFKNDLYNYALGIAGLAVCIASLLWVASSEEDKPCVRYETSMQYNATTKTTMPMRYCAQYGEWVK